MAVVGPPISNEAWVIIGISFATFAGTVVLIVIGRLLLKLPRTHSQVYIDDLHVSPTNGGLMAGFRVRFIPESERFIIERIWCELKIKGKEIKLNPGEAAKRDVDADDSFSGPQTRWYGFESGGAVDISDDPPGSMEASVRLADGAEHKTPRVTFRHLSDFLKAVE